jgi:hypothetical protein
MKKDDCKLKYLVFLVVVVLLVLPGCATPSSIKTASKTQCELIGELDQSIQALKNGLAKFHEDNQEQIRNVGRVQIAKQAIDTIMEDSKSAEQTITVDSLYEISNNQIRPFVDYAFFDSDIDKAIDQVKNDLKDATGIKKNLLETKLNSLNLSTAQLHSKPKAVANLENTLQEEITKQGETENKVKHILDMVRGQVGLMKVMANTVDAWLAVDVTVTKAQADNLESSVVAAQKALGGGK